MKFAVRTHVYHFTPAVSAHQPLIHPKWSREALKKKRDVEHKGLRFFRFGLFEVDHLL